MTVVAAVRPGDVNLALFVHVLGAMLLVGTLLVVASAILVGWRRTEPEAATGPMRLGLRTLILGVLPSYIVMRVGAQWTEAAADYPSGFEATWIDVGYITADLGALLILVSVVLSALGLRALRRGGGTGLARTVAIVAVLLVVAYLVAVWAMSAKPT